VHARPEKQNWDLRSSARSNKNNKDAM
jgi:hypothetical protein